MSKTIRQIAEEIGVSKQAIQKRMTREPLRTSLEPYVKINEQTKYIDETGEIIIKSAFEATTSTVDAGTDKGNLSTDMGIDKSIDGVVALVQENLKVLQAQLTEKDRFLQLQLAERDRFYQSQIAEKDKQISDLTETVKAQAQSINADRHAELAGAIQQQLTDGSSADERENEKPKRRLFGIFGRKEEKT